jgi:hypothetical protein
MAAAAKCRLLVAVSRPLDYEGDPGVCIGKENHIGVMDFDVQEVGQDYSFRTFKPSLVATVDLDAGDLPGGGLDLLAPKSSGWTKCVRTGRVKQDCGLLSCIAHAFGDVLCHLHGPARTAGDRAQ